MFNYTQFLKTFDKRLRWNYRIKKYIKESGKLLEFNKDRSNYYCSVDTALDFIEALNIKEEIKLKVANELYKRRVLELKSEIQIKPTATKTSTALVSDHFNIYGVRNVQELAQNIIKDIHKVKPENIKEVFKDYVYFFTYFYKYNSIRTHISNIRKAIKESDLPDLKKEIAVHEFKFSDRVHDWLNEGNKQNLRVKNMKEVLVPLEVPFLNKFIQTSKKFIDLKINKSNKREAFTILSSLVALSIGRRLTEIVTLSKVERIADYKVRIIGLAKKRTEEPAILEVPTLFLTAEETIKAIIKLRDLIPKGLKGRDQQDKYAHNLADFKLLPSKLWVKGDKFTSLRAMYAVISELIYNQNNIREENRKPQATYIQETLGHGSDDFTTYQHYYKRQILLKDFDLTNYLAISKTAML